MSKQDFIKGQTCILKVDIHCEGCKDKVKKKLQKIDGVYAVKIEAEHGKVTVTGNIDSATLIKKLANSGKHAELWGAQKGSIKNMQIDKDDGDFKGANKSQKSGKQQNNGGGGGGQQVFQQMQNFKGSNKDLKFPKDQKSVKFKIPDDEFDEDSDEFDDDDDEFEDDEFDGHHHLKPTKKAGGGGGGGGGGNNGKKEKANNMGGKNEDKNVNGGKNGKGGKQSEGGKNSGEGKNGNANGKVAGNGGGKNSAGKTNLGEGHDMMKNLQIGGINMNQMLPQMGNYPQMPQMGNYSRGPVAAGGGQGLPLAMNSGLYQGMGQQGMNHQQQQYMAQMMMMNQQQQQQQQEAYGNGMYNHPMMYSRPPPMPAAMPYPPPSQDYSFMFSDENTNSCSIM